MPLAFAMAAIAQVGGTNADALLLELNELVHGGFIKRHHLMGMVITQQALEIGIAFENLLSLSSAMKISQPAARLLLKRDNAHSNGTSGQL